MERGYQSHRLKESSSNQDLAYLSKQEQKEIEDFVISKHKETAFKVLQDTLKHLELDNLEIKERLEHSQRLLDDFQSKNQDMAEEISNLLISEKKSSFELDSLRLALEEEIKEIGYLENILASKPRVSFQSLSSENIKIRQELNEVLRELSNIKFSSLPKQLETERLKDQKNLLEEEICFEKNNTQILKDSFCKLSDNLKASREDLQELNNQNEMLNNSIKDFKLKFKDLSSSESSKVLKSSKKPILKSPKTDEIDLKIKDIYQDLSDLTLLISRRK